MYDFWNEAPQKLCFRNDPSARTLEVKARGILRVLMVQNAPKQESAPGKFNVKAECGWSSSVKCKSKDLHEWQEGFKVPIDKLGVEGEDGKCVTQKEEPVSFEFFHCEKCNFHVPAYRKAFEINNLGECTWCNVCRKSWPVKTWLCKCKMEWHRCSQHKQSPEEMRGGQPHKAS